MAWGTALADPAAAELERSVLGGIAAFRWLAWAFLAIVLVVTRRDLAHPWAAWTLALVALAWTALAWDLNRRRSPWVLRAPFGAAELGLGFLLLACDGYAYGGEHAQSLGSAWPVAGALAMGVIVGPWGGLVAGVVLGAGKVTGSALDDLPAPALVSPVSSAALYGLAGAVAGLVMRQLRRAELAVSAARAREEVARTLHDGVLQTLAVVQRRSTDPALAGLAREQELELRRFLWGGTADDGGDPTDLVGRLRSGAARFERLHGVRGEVVVAGPTPALDPAVVDALAGAVAEALNNVAKHAEATRAVVYVEPGDSEVFCSVKDDGRGAGPEGLREGVGLARSVRGRLAEVGGRAEVDGRPGRGVEVRLWVPR